jgi:hypothetical protein
MDAEMMADHTVAIEISSPIIEALAAGRETRTAVRGVVTLASTVSVFTSHVIPVQALTSRFGRFLDAHPDVSRSALGTRDDHKSGCRQREDHYDRADCDV